MLAFEPAASEQEVTRKCVAAEVGHSHVSHSYLCFPFATVIPDWHGGDFRRSHGGMILASPSTCAVFVSLMMALPLNAGFRTEYFDREPANWEGVNNRNKFFETKTVEQNFGYSAETNHAGGQRGEAGGRINPAGEPAYYGFKLPKPIDLNTSMTAEGRLF